MNISTLKHLGVEVTIYSSLIDGKPIVELDTPEMAEGVNGPLCRVYINDGIVYDGEDNS